jgi:hypothetical protein
MKANPAVAAAAMEQAKKVMATPGMAEGMLQAQRAGPAFAARIAALKDDPDLKDVFAEIAAGGLDAVQKHWDNADLMAKISRKMEALGVGDGEPSAAAIDAPGTPAREGDGDAAAAASAPPPPITKAGPAAATKVVPPPAPPASDALPLHAAAKAGDAATLKKLLAAPGADRPSPDARDAKGITALGTAVGFNRLDCVAALLDGGAAVDGTDGRGNTPLHYAAGYGRLDALKALLAAGADPAATNEAGQTPADAARANGERKAVKLLEARAAKAGEKAGAFVAA